MLSNEKIKKKKEKEPEYVVDLNNEKVINYKTYYMKPYEFIGFLVISSGLGALTGYLFFGGLAKDEFGNPTSKTYILNIVICLLCGLIAARIALPNHKKNMIEKRKKELRRQFRGLLDTLTTSISAGKNVSDSFLSAPLDLKILYSKDDYIMKELEIIKNGYENNIQLEDLLVNFGERSGIDDIKNFADVFQASNALSGNLKDIIQNVQGILSDKMAVEEEIDTVISASRTEQNIMLIMPLFIVAIIKFSDSDFAANFASPSGIISTIIAVVMFIAAYFIGKKMLSIKV